MAVGDITRLFRRIWVRVPAARGGGPAYASTIASPLLLAGGLAAILAPLVMWAEFIGVGLSTPGYNLLTRAASDLGAAGAPTAAFFRAGFFLAPGALTILVGAALLAVPCHSPWWKVGAATVGVEGLFLLLAGLYPENPASASATARHQILAAVCFGAAALAPVGLLAGLSADMSLRMAPRTWAISAPVLLILEVGGLLTRDFANYPDGLFQRPFGLTLTVWYLGTAALLIRGRTASDRGQRGAPGRLQHDSIGDEIDRHLQEFSTPAERGGGTRLQQPEHRV